MPASQTAPLPSIRRLPLYLGYLKTLRQPYVSCTQISDNLDVYPVQARKDLATTGVVGKPKVGYSVPALIEAIESYLGWNQRTAAILIGAGNLGSALLGYGPFSDCGCDIVAAIDADRRKHGVRIHGRTVEPLERLEALIDEHAISVAIITVPGAFAQEIAERLIDNKIRAIWNFTPAKLVVPDEVIVESVQLASSLAVLTTRLHHEDSDSTSI